MIRAGMGNKAYWDEWQSYRYEQIIKNERQIKQPSKNPAYRPQFVWDLAKGGYLRLLITCYSRGDSVRELSQYFIGVLNSWELSDQLAERICRENSLKKCRDWTFELSNLNHYNFCFWLVGLALALDIPEEQWQRLLVLIGGEGEDELLDRVIASRQPSRKIGSQLLHVKPYARLFKVLDSSKEEQAALLRDFVEHWYCELKRKSKEELWWYNYGDSDKHPLEKGSYFGRWCIEAVAVVKAFGVEDGLCLGHEHYPGDLLRPDGPSTHQGRSGKKRKGFFWGLLGKLQGKEGAN